MKANYKRISEYLFFAVLFAFLGYYFTDKYKDTKEVIKHVKTIEKHIDTVKIEITKVEEVVKWKTKEREKLKEKEKDIIYNKEECKEIVDNLKKQLDNCDTIVKLKDTIIYKERLVIEYKDRIIEKLVIPKPKPFGIGVQVGATTTDFKEVKPYIGLGVSYNLIRF